MVAKLFIMPILILSGVIYQTTSPSNYPLNETQINLMTSGEESSWQIKDSCFVADKIKTAILDYLNCGNEIIFTNDFIAYFKENNLNLEVCFFPRNNEETNLYFTLADSCLSRTLSSDNRPLKLIIDLFLVNWINVEFSEYFSLEIIPKAALSHSTSFVTILSQYPDKVVDKCLSSLKYLDKDEQEILKASLNKMNNSKHQSVIKKAQERLIKSL